VKVEWKPVKALFALQRRAVMPEADVEYQEVGVRSFGKGLFIKEPVTGLDLGNKRVFRVKDGDLIVSNVFAWEGAVGLATADHDGLIGSHRFMTWMNTDSGLNTRYILEYFRSKQGVEELAKASPGSAGRNRTLSIKNFEDILVPIPSRPDQDRIAAHLDSVAASAASPPSSVVQALLDRDWPGTPTTVREVVAGVSRPERVQLDKEYELSGLSSAGRGMFVRETRPGREVSSGHLHRVEPGDLVYNRLFAWNRSFAIADHATWVSGEFPTFTVAADRVRPRVLLAALLSPAFTAQVVDASTGTTQTRTRLKERDFLGLTATVPDIDHQPTIERILLAADRGRELQGRAARLAHAILPAARNEVFDSLARR
jgi:hypothetical protein